jgi:colanic acid/amylovoran biosynthesis glycosyltransferase
MTQLQQHELELVNDSVMIRTMEGRINFWNRRAEELYGWRKEEAIGEVSHNLLHTQFPKPLEKIESELIRNGRWEGKLVHTTRDGGRMVVASRWALDPKEQFGPVVEINTPSTNPEAPTDTYSVELGRREPVPERGGPVVCIVSTNHNAYSETFIRAHIERLPAETKVLYGGSFPTYFEDGTQLLKFHQRAIRRVSYRLLGLSPQHLQNRVLKRFLQTNRVDVVLAEYGPTGASVMDACSAAGVPLIVHFHGFDAYHRGTLEKYGLSYHRMFAAAAAIIAVSRDMERQLLTLGASREKLFYSPYGVDTELFSGAEPARVPPIFVAVGRFVDKKAPHLTLRAFKKVTERCPHARLKMVGDGRLWELCKQSARDMGISHLVEFFGPRSHLDVAGTMRQARAFVQHSIRATNGDSEGTPIAVLEAGAAGLPVVATRHAGIKDVVIDGKTGLLVDEGDVEGMARNMIRLAEDPELAERLGKAARESIVAEWSMEKSINRLWTIMEKAIKETGTARLRS